MKNLYLITGNDLSQIRKEAGRLFQNFAGESPDPFGSDIIAEGEGGATVELVCSLIQSLQQPSMLGGRKVVWLKHFSAFDSEGEKSKGGIGAVLRELAEFLKPGLPDDMLLIMDGPGVDRRRALFKNCNAKGEVMFFDKPDMSKSGWQQQMQACLTKALQEKGMAMQMPAQQYLLDALGADTGRIDAELEKIICYRGTMEGEASLDDVRQVCVGKGEEMAWALADMLGRRNVREAMRVIDTLVTQNKEDDNCARGMILNCAGFFRQGIRIRVFMAERKLRTPAALKQYVTAMSTEDRDKYVAEGFDFVSSHPFRVMKLAESAERYRPDEMIAAIRVFRDALRQITSSSTNPRIALESALFNVMGV